MIRIFLAAVAAVLILASAAHAEPWVVSGQTNIATGGGLDNPAVSNTGALGEVHSLPYTVPDAHVLCVEGMSMEGYDAQGIAVLMLYTGHYPQGAKPADRIAHGTASVAADSGSASMAVRYCWPAGTVVNVRLINGSSYGGVYGWQAHGTLTALP